MNPLKGFNDTLARNVAAPLANVASQLDNLGIVFRSSAYELTERVCDVLQPEPTLCLAFLVEPSDGAADYWAGGRGRGNKFTLCVEFLRAGQIKNVCTSSHSWMAHTVKVGGQLRAYGGVPLAALWSSSWPKVRAQEAIELELEWMP